MMSAVNHNPDTSSRRSHAIILIGIGVNCFITLFLLCSLHGTDHLPLALSDSHVRYGYGETSTSTSYSSTNISTTIAQLMPWAASSLSPQDNSDSLEVRRLIGCDHTKWGECVLSASKLASNQAVYVQQFATHKWQAAQRAWQGPTEYDGMDPRFQPRPGWHTNRAFPDISICGLPKAGSSQLHTILKSLAEAVQYGTIKEQCTSRVTYRSIFEDWDEDMFEDWDDEPIIEDRARASGPQLVVQRELYKYYDRLFSGERSTGDLDMSGRQTVNACY
jgi:hypothetical protein